ncbi:MAG: hypothetical protein ACI97X_000304, partial [Oceanospirillaceae bacterium]
VGAGSWDQHYVTPPATQYTKTGLTGGIQYEWKVKTSCAADSPDGYGPAQLFTLPVVRLASATSGDAAINVFPNPTSGMITVVIGESEQTMITVRNIHGQVIHRESLIDTKQLDMELTGAKGLYTIEVMTSDGQNEVFRVVKE